MKEDQIKYLTKKLSYNKEMIKQLEIDKEDTSLVFACSFPQWIENLQEDNKMIESIISSLDNKHCDNLTEKAESMKRTAKVMYSGEYLEGVELACNNFIIHVMSEFNE